MINFIKKGKSKKIILFVHGFTGGKTTWINSKNKHLGESLVFNEDADDYNIAEFIYHTKIFDAEVPKNIFRFFMPRNYKAVKKTVKIEEVSELLKTEVLVKLKNYNEVIIVAHSMGGLITKSYILKCLDENINHKCALFISLAVPHKGSNSAAIASLFSSNKQIGDLEPLSEYIDTTNKRWEGVKEGLLPTIVYVYGLHDSIVPKTSAAPNQPWYAVDHDHLSISKPENDDDLIVDILVSSINGNTEELKDKTTFLLKMLDDPAQYDGEDFVIKMIIADLHQSAISNAKVLFYNTDNVQRSLKDDDASMHALEDLYVRIKVIYNDNYALFCSGKISDSAELLNIVYKQICKEEIISLRALADNISQHHKKGMIHHLANQRVHNIWWSLNGNYEEIEGIRNAGS